MSASRARVACQWKAKPRIRTTNPVVAESVTVRAVSDAHAASASARPCMIASSPFDPCRLRTVPKAGLPSASGISKTPDAGDDDAVAVGNQPLAAGRARPGRHHAFELGLQPTLEAGLRLFQPFEPINQEIGTAFDLLDDVADRLATM